LRIASKSVSEPPPAPMMRPRSPVELLHVAGDAAVVGRVDLRALDLERRRRTRLARLVLADAELGDDLRVLVARVAFEVDVAVEHEDAAVLRLADRVDLGERQVVALEDVDEHLHDRRELAEVFAGDAGRGDGLLRLVGLEGQQVRDVRPRDVLGVLLGDLLDVDAAHVGEDDDGALPSTVPRDGGKELLLDRRLLLDEHAARLVAVDLELQDRVGRGLGLLRCVRELDAAGLHASAGQHLRFEDDRPGDLRGDLLRFGGRLRDASLQQRDAVLCKERLASNS
jgi:hypothetical protein